MMPEAVFDYLLKAYWKIDWTTKPTDTTWNYPHVHKIHIEKVPRQDESHNAMIWLNVSILLTEVTDYPNAKAIAEEAISQIIDGMICITERPIHKVLLQGGCFDGQWVEGHAKTGTMYGPAMIVRRAEPHIDHDLGRDLEIHLNSLNSKSSNYHPMFVAAMKATGIGKFLLLYLILLTHCHDKQEEVDELIRSTTPLLIPETPSPHKKGKTETVHTRLRNEISHARKGTTQTKTAAEMEQNMGSLISIVKRLL